jgi:hypothetical protein
LFEIACSLALLLEVVSDASMTGDVVADFALGSPFFSETPSTRGHPLSFGVGSQS